MWKLQLKYNISKEISDDSLYRAKQKERKRFQGIILHGLNQGRILFNVRKYSAILLIKIKPLQSRF